MLDLRNLPAVRKLAEERARESWDVVRAGLRTVFGQHVAIEFPVPAVQRVVVEAELALLCDLQRPDSRDAIARLVAEKLGWEPWQIWQAIDDGGTMWFQLCASAGVNAESLDCEASEAVLTATALAVLA